MCQLIKSNSIQCHASSTWLTTSSTFPTSVRALWLVSRNSRDMPMLISHPKWQHEGNTDKTGIDFSLWSTLLILHLILTQLFLRGPFFQKGDSFQDRPEHHTQGKDVRLGRVGQSSPHLWSHVEVRATGRREVLPGQVPIHQTFTHLA